MNIAAPHPDSPRVIDNLQFVHGFYAWRDKRIFRSPFLLLIAPVLESFVPMRLIKVKLNHTLPRPRHVEYGLHVDTRRRGAVTTEICRVRMGTDQTRGPRQSASLSMRAPPAETLAGSNQRSNPCRNAGHSVSITENQAVSRDRPL